MFVFGTPYDVSRPSEVRPRREEAASLLNRLFILGRILLNGSPQARVGTAVAPREAEDEVMSLGPHPGETGTKLAFCNV